MNLRRVPTAYNSAHHCPRRISFMKRRMALSGIGILIAIGVPPAFPQGQPLNRAPAGFVSLFNGKDLSGWRGRQGTYSPHAEALLSKEELTAKQIQWNAERDLHWS